MKELKITIPENQEIDWQESAKQEKIVFKQKVFKPKSWEEYCNNTKNTGYYIDLDSAIEYIEDETSHLDNNFDKNLLPTEKLAKSFLALIQLMSLRQAWIGDWKPDWTVRNPKYYIVCVEDKFIIADSCWTSRPLNFPVREMAEEFLGCFKDLINEARDLI